MATFRIRVPVSHVGPTVCPLLVVAVAIMPEDAVVMPAAKSPCMNRAITIIKGSEGRRRSEKLAAEKARQMRITA
jgi:hypothetical protein